MDTHDGGVSDHVYEVDGRDITIGDKVEDPIITTSDHYQTSDINRALVHEVLRLAGFGGKKVDLIVTLPVETFFRASKREEKKAHILKPVTHANNQPLAIIERVRVAPEAVPVLDAICLDNKGQAIPEFQDIQKVMIVDIGGTTTDISIVNFENDVEARKSVSIGVFNIASQLKDLIQNDPNINARNPNDNTIDLTLRSGNFRKDTDVSHHIDHACNQITGKLLAAMNALYSDPDDLDYVVYVGGGAYLLASKLSKQYGGNTLSFENPEYAVALGLLRNELNQTETA
ncbi:plasmid segregation protein ParM-like [Entelurus aequoreus]|uniref:plasmid segregation protein ParM-like n=1 Tax=Entelurus aequoreus TaxID=161455 RepID=UPI002B1D9957|nr:plasmid segregation protein ParM-like [Entelurus aequoreus]